jgi:outer membrane protein OmpA-like peptidoglycan-associated protein
MENMVRKDTVGKVEEIDAKYELLKRGQYERLTNPLSLKLDRKVPLELYVARNAVQIARAIGADTFATDTFNKAVISLARAEAYQARKAGKNPVTMTAREAVQTAEDARAIAVTRQEEQALAAERQQSVDREARAESGRATAQSETDRVTREAETARINAQANAERLARENNAQAAAASAEANRVQRDNDARLTAAAADADQLRRENEARLATATANSDRLKRENDLRLAAASTEADRLKRENDERASSAKNEVDRLRLENETQRNTNQAQLDNVARQKAQLEAEKAELRAQLMTQFNVILQTRDSARGLIVNMSDVLFDTGKYSLQPTAREKLAKVAGILSGHPGLKLEVEGHTDSVGGDDYNQKLSEQRGGAVRDYLTAQGMPVSSVTMKGLGETQPLVSNDTPSGRQQNRRVEIVISGEAIGTVIGTIAVQ